MPFENNNEAYVISNPQNIHPEVNNAFAEHHLGPRNYAGICELTYNNDISSVKDTGGLVKYKGINHDSVTAVASDLADPIKDHMNFIASVSDKIKESTEEKDGSGSTLTLITTKGDKIYTTFVGDSPAWAFEIDQNKKVKVHTLHDAVVQNSPIPFKTNVIRNYINDTTGHTTSNIDLPGLDNKEEIKINNTTYLSKLKEGSRVIILAGSDGLTNHIKLSKEKYNNYQKFPTFDEANNISDLYRKSNGTSPDISEEDKKKFAALITEGNQDIQWQLDHTAKMYAAMIKDHLEENKDVIDYEKLGAQILLLSNALTIEANTPAKIKGNTSKSPHDHPETETKENTSIALHNHLKTKDNTSFILSEVKPGEQKTIVIADGNGANGKKVSSMLTEYSKEFFSTEPNKSSLLETEGSKSYQFDAASKVISLVESIHDSKIPGEAAERLRIAAKVTGQSVSHHSAPFTKASDDKAMAIVKSHKYSIAAELAQGDNVKKTKEEWNRLDQDLGFANDLMNLKEFQRKRPQKLTEIVNEVINKNLNNDDSIARPTNDKEAMIAANETKLKPFFQPIFNRNAESLSSKVDFLREYLLPASRSEGKNVASEAAKSFEQHPSKHVRKIGDALANSGKLMGETTHQPIEPPKQKFSKFLNQTKAGRKVKLAAGGGAIVAAGLIAASSAGTAVGLAAAGFSLGVAAGTRAAYKKERMNAEIENRDFQWKNALNDSLKNAADAVTGKRFIPSAAKTSDSSMEGQKASKGSSNSGLKGFLVSAYKFAANAATLNIATTAAYLHEGRDFDKVRKQLESERMATSRNGAVNVEEASTSTSTEIAQAAKPHPMQKAYANVADAGMSTKQFASKNVGKVADKAYVNVVDAGISTKNFASKNLSKVAELASSSASKVKSFVQRKNEASTIGAEQGR